MTVELSRIEDDLEFDAVKQRVREKIREVKKEKNVVDLNADEKLRVTRDVMGGFTVEGLAKSTPEVSESKARDKVNFWLSVGDVEAATTTRTGAVAYRITTGST